MNSTRQPRSVERITFSRIAVVALFVTMPLVVTSTTLSAYTFTTLDYPGAVETSVNGTNDRGHVVGTADDHGFLWKNGTFTQIDVPGALFTEASGINNRGQIVGWYFSGSDRRQHGFLRERDGSFTTIDPPTPGSFRTFAYSINNKGDIVGSFFDGVEPGTHGFVRKGGAYTIIDVPDYPFTRVFGGNSARQIAGTIAADDGSAPRRGFIHAGGIVTAIDNPDASSGSENPPNTFVTNLDDALRVVGYYIGIGSTLQSSRMAVQQSRVQRDIGRDMGKVIEKREQSRMSSLSSLAAVRFSFHGFVLAGGKFTTVDVPGAVDTLLMASNTAGLLVGQYTDADGFRHGFLVQP
jgi:hypothetical protein